MSAAVRVRDELVRKLVQGDIAPGTRIPSETELATSAGISRHTAAHVLNDLRKRGLVHRVQGRGTYANHRSGGKVFDITPAYHEVNLTLSSAAGPAVLLYDAGLAVGVLRPDPTTTGTLPAPTTWEDILGPPAKPGSIRYIRVTTEHCPELDALALTIHCESVDQFAGTSTNVTLILDATRFTPVAHTPISR